MYVFFVNLINADVELRETNCVCYAYRHNFRNNRYKCNIMSVKCSCYTTDVHTGIFVGRSYNASGTHPTREVFAVEADFYAFIWRCNVNAKWSLGLRLKLYFLSHHVELQTCVDHHVCNFRKKSAANEKA